MDREKAEKEVKRAIAEGFLENRRIGIYGTAFPQQYLSHLLHYHGYEASAFFSSNPRFIGKKMCGVEILDSSMIDSSCLNAVGWDSAGEETYVFDLDLDKKRISWDEAFSEEGVSHAFAEVDKGREVYERLHVSGETLLVFPTASLGDIFLIMMFIETFLSEKGIRKFRFVHSVVGNKVLDLFDESDRVAVTDAERSALVRFLSVMTEGDADAVVLYPRVPLWREHVGLLRGTWGEAIVHATLGLYPSKSSFRLPVFDDVPAEEIRSAGLVEGKTVILSPYAQSQYEFHPLFWEELAMCLSSEGFEVITSVVGSERAVAGTRGVFIPLAKLEAYLRFAGYFIALRSGVCDVTSMISGCKQWILYQERLNPEGEYITSIGYETVKTVFSQADVSEKSFRYEDRVGAIEEIAGEIVGCPDAG